MASTITLCWWGGGGEHPVRCADRQAPVVRCGNGSGVLGHDGSLSSWSCPKTHTVEKAWYNKSTVCSYVYIGWCVKDNIR